MGQFERANACYGEATLQYAPYRSLKQRVNEKAALRNPWRLQEMQETSPPPKVQTLNGLYILAQM